MQDGFKEQHNKPCYMVCTPCDGVFFGYDKMKRLIKKIYLYIRFGTITERIVDRIEGIPCEIAYYDRNGKMIGYWAYGYFDPEGGYKG